MSPDKVLPMSSDHTTRFVKIFGPRRLPLHFRSTEVSCWYYNQGSDRLFRIVKLVNGRVVEIESEGFGVDP